MKKIYVIIALLLVAPFDSRATNLSRFTSQANQFFNKWVVKGDIDYASLKNKFVEIESLYRDINTMNLNGAPPEKKKSFYINAYNLAVIYQVTKYYPLKSPLDQSGFFNKVKHTIAGKSMTLNYLEILVLMKKFKDPRIHFAIACASRSCPALASYAFKSNGLDTKLDMRAELVINNPEYVAVNKSDQSVRVTKIFKWYENDFLTNTTSVIRYLNKYRKKKIPENYALTYMEYNWKLNEQQISR